MVTKNVLDNKVKKQKVEKNGKKFNEYRVGSDKRTDGDSSRELFVVFDGEVDYVVEKLKIKNSGLESRYNGKDVAWLNFFQVKHRDGKYVDGVTYSVYFQSDAAEIVYYDGSDYGTQATQDSTWNETPMKMVTFRRGDPGIGVTT
jgi:hypothetical protein